jgi:hypothetical protein
VPARAAENVATLVSRLRRALGAGVIAGGRGGYQLGGPGVVEVDLDRAGRWVAEAEQRIVEGEPGLGMAAARRAVDLVGVGTALDDEPGQD